VRPLEITSERNKNAEVDLVVVAIQKTLLRM